MNEFEEKDYEAARNSADAIKLNGDNIMQIFNDIDGVMNSLYGSNWESVGAEAARDRYNQIRSNYQVFYDRIVAMRNHIHTVTEANEAADKSASQSVASV